MNVSALIKWLKQPTTVSGVATAAATLAGLAAHYLTHDMTLTATVAAGVLAVTKIVLPDNTGAQSSIEKLFADALNAAVQQRVRDSVGQLTMDGMSVVTALTQPAPVASVTVAVPVAAASPLAG